MQIRRQNPVDSWPVSVMNPASGWTGDRALDNYEIRIVKQRKSGPFIYHSPQASDHAAVRCAQSLIEDGDRVEVWRGLDCIYATDERRASRP